MTKRTNDFRNRNNSGVYYPCNKIPFLLVESLLPPPLHVAYTRVCVWVSLPLCPRSSPRFVSLNSLNLPPGTCAIFPSSFFLSLFSRVVFKPTPRIHWNYFFKRASRFEFRRVVFVCIRACFSFLWSNRWKKIRLTWLITGKSLWNHKSVLKEIEIFEIDSYYRWKYIYINIWNENININIEN